MTATPPHIRWASLRAEDAWLRDRYAGPLGRMVEISQEIEAEERTARQARWPTTRTYRRTRTFKWLHMAACLVWVLNFAQMWQTSPCPLGETTHGWHCNLTVFVLFASILAIAVTGILTAFGWDAREL